jgi:flagellin
MGLSINTNIASMNAQRNLGKTQGTLNKSLQRLSSGLRINSAKDDAAGLGISNRMNAQIRGLNQAARNANDGISLGQTAEGALQETTSLLQRMRELAIQSANDTNSGDDRASIQAEVSQLISELDRIATSTQFNGKNLLDGTMGTATFHIGANANQAISMTITSARATQLGARATGSSDVAQTAILTETDVLAILGQQDTGFTGVDNSAAIVGGGDVTINGTDIDATVAEDAAAGKTAGSAYAKAAAINSSGVEGVSVTASTTKTFADLGSGEFLQNGIVDQAADSTIDYSLTINGDEVFTQSFTFGTANVSIDDIVISINNNTGDTGVIATKDGSDQLVLTASDGRDIIIEDEFVYTQGTADVAEGMDTVFSSLVATNGADESATYSSEQKWGGSLSFSSTTDITLTGQANLGRSVGISINSSNNISTVDVSTVSNANSAIETIDAALSSVDSSRASLGAAQNRFESTISNLQNISENLSAARSRIMDADFAVETAALTKSQILQQAGVAMLAQANQLPQTVLSLLQ